VSTTFSLRRMITRLPPLPRRQSRQSFAQFEDGDGRLSAALAHRLQSVAHVRAFHLIERRCHNAGAGHTSGVP